MNGNAGTPIDSTKYTLVSNRLLIEANKDLIRLDKCKAELSVLKNSYDNLTSIYNIQTKKVENLEERNKQLNFRVAEKDTLLNNSIKENALLYQNYQKDLKLAKRKNTGNIIKTAGVTVVAGFIIGFLIH